VEYKHVFFFTIT